MDKNRFITNSLLLASRMTTNHFCPLFLLITNRSYWTQSQNWLIRQIRIFFIKIKIIGIHVMSPARTPIISKRIFSIDAIVTLSSRTRQKNTLTRRTRNLATSRTIISSPTPSTAINQLFKFFSSRCSQFTTRKIISCIILGTWYFYNTWPPSRVYPFIPSPHL